MWTWKEKRWYNDNLLDYFDLIYINKMDKSVEGRVAMDIVTYTQAVTTLDNEAENPSIREKAIQYLSEHPDSQAIERIVRALEDDNFGVRWEASKALSALGRDGLIALLVALTDPARAGDVRLRNGAYRVLKHLNFPDIDHQVWNLIMATKGPAADLLTMIEANKLLEQLRSLEKLKEVISKPSKAPSWPTQGDT